MPAPTLVVGAPCWIDLYSSDPDKATKFYGELLGWTAQPPEEGFGGYFRLHEGRQGGCRMHAQRRVVGLPGCVGSPST